MQTADIQTYLQDRQSIADLMTGWIHRDLAQWDSLRDLFHPEGEIEVTWFEGLASEFIDASMRMGQSDLRTKHFIASPVVTFNGNKAIVETNAVIVAENVRLHLGGSAHNRFYDLVEKHQASEHLRHGLVHLSTRCGRDRRCGGRPLSARICAARLSTGKKWLSSETGVCDERQRTRKRHEGCGRGMAR